MSIKARAVPILPTRSVTDAETFYRDLGFLTAYRKDGPSGYLIMTLGEVELQFFHQPDLAPARNEHCAYIRCEGIDTVAALFSMRQLPLRGIPRFEPPVDREWGMREAYLVDPDGNLLRLGEPVKS